MAPATATRTSGSKATPLGLTRPQRPPMQDEPAPWPVENETPMPPMLTPRPGVGRRSAGWACIRTLAMVLLRRRSRLTPAATTFHTDAFGRTDAARAATIRAAARATARAYTGAPSPQSPLWSRPSPLTAEQNFAEMAQRLEAALRKPARAKEPRVTGEPTPPPPQRKHRRPWSCPNRHWSKVTYRLQHAEPKPAAPKSSTTASNRRWQVC